MNLKHLSGVLLLIYMAVIAGIIGVQGDDVPYKSDEILVKFKKGVSEETINSINAKIGTSRIRIFRKTGVYHLKLTPGVSVTDAIKAYNFDPNVEYAEPNFIVYITYADKTPSVVGAISPVTPTWYIGDSWEISVYLRDISLLYADREIQNRDYGEFNSPSIQTFKVVGKKIIDGEECFVIETDIDMRSKLLLYYSVNGVNLKKIEDVRKSDGVVITNEIFEKGLQIDPIPWAHLLLSWPDFSNLDPANSPQTIMESGRSIRQEVTVNGDVLTVIWKLDYKEEDGTYSYAIMQEWKMGNKWWSKSEYIRGKDSKIIEKAELGISVVPIKAQVVIEPETFNKNTGTFTAFVTFPEGYDVSTITDAVCDGAPAYNMQYNKGKNEMILKFRRDQVTEQPLNTTFVVTGHFSAGLVFEGSDEILKIKE